MSNTIWEEVGAVALPCDGVAAWVSTQAWNTYTVGDQRTDAGGLYTLHTQAWAQAKPSGATGYLGWTFIQNCA